MQPGLLLLVPGVFREQGLALGGAVGIGVVAVVVLVLRADEGVVGGRIGSPLLRDLARQRLHYNASMRVLPRINGHDGYSFSREPVSTWFSCAQLLYTNWLNYYVYQTTPYDITRAGEKE